MKAKNMFDLFVQELRCIYDAELQIIEALPYLARAAQSKMLKTAFNEHLAETEMKAERLAQIFEMLEVKLKSKKCKAMRSILSEAEELIHENAKSPLLDAALINAAQKVEHYEIATYGTLKSFAKHLTLGRQITNLIQETLKEELNTDKKLTAAAESSFQDEAGLNELACAMSFAGKE